MLMKLTTGREEASCHAQVPRTARARTSQESCPGNVDFNFIYDFALLLTTIAGLNPDDKLLNKKSLNIFINLYIVVSK
jgi:hypothetical protein